MEKQIDGFSKYKFSDCGKVFALDKKGKREIKGAKDKDGYLKITLVSDEKKNIYFRKHRLIAWAFLGKSDMQVNHKDGNILNNALNNLEYVSQMENQSHRRKRSGYEVGVCWAKKENKWRSYLQHNKKWYHLGFYEEKHKAKEAYNKKLHELNISNRYS